MARGDLNLFFSIPDKLFAELIINSAFRNGLNKLAAEDSIRVFYKDTQPTKLSFSYKINRKLVQLVLTKEGLCAHSCDNLELNSKQVQKIINLIKTVVDPLIIKEGVEGIDVPAGVENLMLDSLLRGNFQKLLSDEFAKSGLKASIVTLRVVVSNDDKDVGGFDLFHRNQNSLNDKYLQFLSSDERILTHLKNLLSEAKK